MAAGMVYAGRVVAVEEAGPRVVVPQLGGTGRFGPLPSAVPDLAVGETVIVTNLGISRDQLVVLGRMAGRVPEVDEIPGLAATLDAHDTRLDAVELDNATDQQVLDDHGARITAGEARDGQQDGRLTATEGVANGAASGAAAASAAAATLRADTAGKATTKGDLLIATAAGTLARQPVVPTGWMLSGDPNTATGWASRDVLGLPRGLTGAVAPTRYVGGTAAGAPTTGTFAAGDFVVCTNGDLHVCTVAGTPGTWALHPGNGPRGTLARARRVTNTFGNGGAVLASAVKVSEVSAALLPGRLYKVGSPNSSAYSDTAGQMRLILTYTSDGSTPSPTSPVLTWSQVATLANGIVDICPIETHYVAATAQTFRLLLSIHPTIHNGAGWGTYASAEWPLELAITDKGPVTALSGTHF